jgi:hypothetical protein
LRFSQRSVFNSVGRSLTSVHKLGIRGGRTRVLLAPRSSWHRMSTGALACRSFCRANLGPSGRTSRVQVVHRWSCGWSDVRVPEPLNVLSISHAEGRWFRSPPGPHKPMVSTLGPRSILELSEQKWSLSGVSGQVPLARFPDRGRRVQRPIPTRPPNMVGALGLSIPITPWG